MSVLKKIREALDQRLDRWDAQLDALEAQLAESRDEALERVQAARNKLAAALRQVQEKLEDAADLTADELAELRADLEELQVQLALGKAETRDAFEAQRRRLHRALQAVEQRLELLERKAEGKLTEELEDYVRLADRLRAEIDAAELQFWLFKAEQREALEKRRRELQHKLAELRATAKLQAKEAAEKVEEFEQRLATELNEFRDNFRRLIGGH
ncbi:MAG: hypothetical protein D6727_08910 [Gammaproteobacteria bacterium]|nr:MAG: hypothetical protein D6727_08910 [Gammaproteobacteria bacterium]